MAECFCPSSSSFLPIRVPELPCTSANTEIRTRAHTAFPFVSILGGFNKSHSSFQGLTLSGLLETASALREFKPGDPRTEQVAFFFH